MNNSPVLIDRQHPHCTLITLNRPEKRNALTIDLMEQLCHHIEEIQKKPDQRALIIKGEGSVFCSGLDLEEAMNASFKERSSIILGRLLKTLFESPLITIASIQGAALAGGGGIICACDLAIAEEGSLFGFPETRRGLVPAQIMPYIIRLIPRRLLQELLFLGEPIEARRAYEIGLINEIVPAFSATTRALDYVKLINKGAPQATFHAKKWIQEMDSLDSLQRFKQGLELHLQSRQGSEAKEGMEAFLQKRLPYWEVS